jgi:hypothetical protein
MLKIHANDLLSSVVELFYYYYQILSNALFAIQNFNEICSTCSSSLITLCSLLLRSHDSDKQHVTIGEASVAE